MSIILSCPVCFESYLNCECDDRYTAEELNAADALMNEQAPDEDENPFAPGERFHSDWEDHRVRCANDHALPAHCAQKGTQMINSNDLDEEFDNVTSEEFSGDINETDMLALQIQTIMDEIATLSLRVLRHLDRMKYYGEPVTQEELEFLMSELNRISRDLL